MLGLEPEDALAAPRVHHQGRPATLRTETFAPLTEELLARLTVTINELERAVGELDRVRAAAESDALSEAEQAVRIRDVVSPAMAAVRTHADALERCVDDDLWPLPKYGELLSLD